MPSPIPDAAFAPIHMGAVCVAVYRTDEDWEVLTGAGSTACVGHCLADISITNNRPHREGYCHRLGRVRRIAGRARPTVQLSAPHGLIDPSVSPLFGCECQVLDKEGEYVLVILIEHPDTGAWEQYQLWGARPDEDGITVGDENLLDRPVTFTGITLEHLCGDPSTPPPTP